MIMFDISDVEMINLEMIEFVKFGKLDGEKSVVVGIGSRSFVVPKSRHKEFFHMLTRLGIQPTKQFVSL